MSDSVTLQRGSRQGCPLSPLLFSIYIEPVAQWLRQKAKIKGILLNEEDHKVALYADDILLFLSEPSSTLPELLNVLQRFSSLSGYKLNLQKTQLLTFNYSPPKQIKDKFPFE